VQVSDILLLQMYGLSHKISPEAISENIFLLVTTALIKVVLTAWAFGMMVPAGIFLPTIATGACVGRAFGLLL
jgi:chloride channel 3/4/5